MRAASTLAWSRELGVAALVVFLAAPRPAGAQVTATGRDGTVSIRATQATLGSVLRALERVVTFEQLRLDPSVDQIPVSVTFDELDVRSALRAILDAADVNYVLLADDDGKSVRLTASRSAFVGRLDQRSAVAAEANVERASVERVGHADTASDSAPSIAASRESHETFTFGSGGQIAGSTATGPSSPFSTAGQTQAFEHALVQPALPAVPGSVVQLPFPDALGAPLVSVVGVPNANPVPLPGLATSAQPPPPSAASSSNPIKHEPHVQELIDAVSPKPRR